MLTSANYHPTQIQLRLARLFCMYWVTNLKYLSNVTVKTMRQWKKSCPYRWICSSLWLHWARCLDVRPTTLLSWFGLTILITLLSVAAETCCKRKTSKSHWTLPAKHQAATFTAKKTDFSFRSWWRPKAELKESDLDLHLPGGQRHNSKSLINEW